MPTTWDNNVIRNGSDTADLARWWERLRDPLLDELIEKSVRDNLDVATAKAKVREARASYRSSVGALYPTLNIDASASRSHNGSGATVQSTSAVGLASTTAAGAGITNQYQAGFDSSWEIDLFGGNRRAIEAAGYGVEAAQEDLRQALLQLIGDVARSYVEARGYQARLELARQTARAQRETAELTQVKFESGGVSGLDAANANGAASVTDAEIHSLESAYAEAVHRIGVLLGQTPSGLAASLERPLPVPSLMAAFPTSIPADVLLARPDVRRAERQLAQATAKIGEAKAALYPSISLTGSIFTSGDRLRDLARASTIAWTFGPTISIPLFRGGKLEGAVQVAEAQRDQYYLAFRASILSALEDIENALTSFTEERERWGRLSAAVASYDEAVRIAKQMYEAGSTSLLELLTAQRSLYSAQDSLIQSQILLTSNYIALNKAFGGGWDGLIDVSSKEVIDTNAGPHITFIRR